MVKRRISQGNYFSGKRDFSKIPPVSGPSGNIINSGMSGQELNSYSAINYSHTGLKLFFSSFEIFF